MGIIPEKIAGVTKGPERMDIDHGVGIAMGIIGDEIIILVAKVSRDADLRDAAERVMRIGMLLDKITELSTGRECNNANEEGGQDDEHFFCHN